MKTTSKRNLLMLSAKFVEEAPDEVRRNAQDIGMEIHNPVCVSFYKKTGKWYVLELFVDLDTCRIVWEEESQCMVCGGSVDDLSFVEHRLLEDGSLDHMAEAPNICSDCSEEKVEDDSIVYH